MSTKILPYLPFIATMGETGLANPMRCYSLGGTIASVAWGTTNQAVFVPFYCPTIFSFTTFTWRNGATISGNLDVGVYSWDGRAIVTIGSTAQAAGANAIQTAAVSSTKLYVGQYWLGMSLSSATGTIFCATAVNVGICMTMGVFNQANALPLPTTTFTPVDPTIKLIPLVSIS